MTIKSQKSYTIKGLIADGAELFDKEALYYGHGTDNSTDEAAYIVLTVTNKLPLDDDVVLEKLMYWWQKKFWLFSSGELRKKLLPPI